MNDVNYLLNNGVDVEKSLELFGDIETYNASIQDFVTDASEKLAKLRTFKAVSYTHLTLPTNSLV